MIWHIDTMKDDNLEEGFPGQYGWPENNKHYKVALLGADGSYHLEKGGNPGDAGDVFQDGSGLDSSTDSFPNTASYQNGVLMETGIQIKNIRSDGENMLFDICFNNTCAPSGGEPKPVNDSGNSDGCITGYSESWIDSYSVSCDWYESHIRPGCPYEGVVRGTNGVPASEACCHCKSKRN